MSSSPQFSHAISRHTDPFHFSAKELEHYHRVRQTFEGPSKTQSSNTPLPPATQVPPHATNSHLEPPVPTKRPTMKGRSSTSIPKAISPPKSKGKGKATNWDSDDDDDDDAYVTSNDFVETPERRKSGMNGSFGEGADNDEDLYRR